MTIQTLPSAGPAWRARQLSVLLAIGAASAVQATIVNTTDSGVATTFQTGAAVETFDDLSALTITSYSSTAVPAGNQFSGRNLANTALPAFNSGGATFADPFANPGTRIGIFDPDGGIATNFHSANNVAGPLQVGTDQSFGSGFMETIFRVPVSKVGFWVTHGSVQLILKDVTNNNLVVGDVTVTGTEGSFIGIDRGTADIGGITLISAGAAAANSFTLDDFTSFAATTTVPEASSSLSLLALGAFGWLTCRIMKAGRAGKS